MSFSRFLSIFFAFALAVSAANVSAGVLVESETLCVDVTEAIAIGFSETDDPGSPMIEVNRGNCLNAILVSHSNATQPAMMLGIRFNLDLKCSLVLPPIVPSFAARLPMELLKIPIA
ncbi:MAG: hypothetical protein KDB00_19375 [Planctomycetales bacterium]|nr:hypothetical protein [Planctomycetales bacterium]